MVTKQRGGKLASEKEDEGKETDRERERERERGGVCINDVSKGGMKDEKRRT